MAAKFRPGRSDVYYAGVVQRKRICDDLAKNLAETYGQTASSILHAGEGADAKFKAEIECRANGSNQ